MSRAIRWFIAVLSAVVVWAVVVYYHYIRRAANPFDAATLHMLASNSNKGLAIGGTILAGWSVVIGPLAGLLRPFGGWASARREMGLAGFYMLAGHVVLSLVIPLAGLQKGLDWSWYTKNPWSLGFAIASFLLLCLIAATSYGSAAAKPASRGWKAIQRLVYLALALGIFHYMALNKGQITSWVDWWTTPQRLPSGQVVLRGLPGGTLLLTTIMLLFLAIRYVAFLFSKPCTGNDKPAASGS